MCIYNLAKSKAFLCAHDIWARTKTKGMSPVCPSPTSKDKQLIFCSSVDHTCHYLSTETSPGEAVCLLLSVHSLLKMRPEQEHSESQPNCRGLQGRQSHVTGTSTWAPYRCQLLCTEPPPPTVALIILSKEMAAEIQLINQHWGKNF